MDARVPATKDFFERARARLSLDVPASLTDPAAQCRRGDLDLDPAMWERVGVSATKPAVVLIPVIEHNDPSVLLTQRTAELPSHPGQIAFPGGKIDREDAGPLAAALRETKEEIGIDEQFIEPIGYLDLYLTFSGFRILPVVARVKPNYSLKLNSSEVSEAFEVPLDFLMTTANHQFLTRDWKGIQRQYYAMPYQQRYIWGVTAGILRNMYERIYGGMIRPVFTEVALFAAPFVAYAIFLVATRLHVFDRSSWPPKTLATLSIISLLLVLGSFLVLAHFSGAPPGSTYEPAHLENGQFVPGRTR